MSDRPANSDMVEGYLDGFQDDRSDFPAGQSNRGASYRHGWLNGRDDRVRKPRASYEVLRAQALMAMALDDAS